MNQFGFGIFDGSIYKKAPDACFTYVHCSSVKDFIHHILGNLEVADQIASYVNPIINLLSQKSCKIIQPISIDYNFIEVQPRGVCFNISRKTFEKDPSDLKGK